MNFKFENNHSDITDYWENYHKKGLSRDIPLEHVLNKLSNDIFSGIDLPRILEIGCGEGRNLTYFSQYSIESVGCDISDTALIKASKISGGRIRLVQNTVDYIPLKDDSFDLIIFSKVLSTIFDTKALKTLIINANRLLSENGRVLIIDFIFDNGRNNEYSKIVVEGKVVNIISPIWSKFPFVHYTPKDLADKFYPLTKVTGFNIQLESCQNKYDKGYVTLLKR